MSTLMASITRFGSGRPGILTLVALGLAVAGYLLYSDGTRKSPESANATRVGQSVQAIQVQDEPAEGGQESAALRLMPGALSESAIAVPPRFQFAGVTSVRRASTHVDLLSHYAADEREQIEGYFARVWPSIGEFYGEAQQEWLISQGFPTPEDVLHATRLDDQALFEQASGGNIKAAYFHVDRMMQRMAESGRLPLDLPIEAMWEEEEKLQPILQRMLASGSPYAGFVLAQTAERYRDPVQRDLRVLEGNAWASLRGYSPMPSYRPPASLGRAEQNRDISPSSAIIAFQTRLLQISGSHPGSTLHAAATMPPPDRALWEAEYFRRDGEALAAIKAAERARRSGSKP